MTLLAILVQAVQSFRQRRGAVRPRKRAEICLEQLDHRQLLAVNFTGNVTADFTAATPAVYLTDPLNHQPTIPPNLQPFIAVSGFAVQNVAVNYDQATDTLSVGFLQPENVIGGIPTGSPVIAGDADDNLNNSTTSAGAAAQGVKDDPAISQTENFNALIDLSGGTNTANESIFVGIPNSATPGYTNSRYVVAPAFFNAGTAEASAVPVPGAELTQNEGNIFIPFNDPRHGALEFSITHFSQLYQNVTGHALTGTSQINIGASAGSGDDGGIDEQIFHFQALPVGTATTPIPPPPVPPPPPPPPPPVIIELFQPTILINPHENRHINTAHYDDIRVTVLSSASFDSRQIDPSTVRFGGAAPVAYFSKIQLHDGLYSTTFVFKGTDINLPSGFTVAPITGQTFGGVLFSGAELVFNRNDSFYSQAQIQSRDARLTKFGATVAQEAGATSLAALTDPTATATPTATVRITPRQAAVQRAAAREQAMLSTVAAKSFLSTSTPITAPAQSLTSSSSASSASAALIAHDLALQSIGSTASSPSAV